MARAFCIPGIVLLFIALALSVLVTISLPTVHTFDIVRVRFKTGTNSNGGSAVDSFRWGIWGYCVEAVGHSSFNCHHTGLAYDLPLVSQADPSAIHNVGKSYTRGLILHPIALAATFVAFLLSFSEHVVITLAASLVSFFAALLTLIAFAIDIALYARVHHQAGDLKGVKENTDFGPGFWFTLVQFVLLVLAGFTVCFGRRRDRVSRGGDSYPMLDKRPWWKKRLGMGKNAY